MLVNMSKPLAVLFGLLMLVLPAQAEPSLDAFGAEIMTATKEGNQERAKALFAPDLAKAYAVAESNTEELVIDFDFLSASQDPDLDLIARTITMTATRSGAGAGQIRIEFGRESRASIVYDARLVDGEWRIRDILFPDWEPPASMREIVGLER